MSMRSLTFVIILLLAIGLTGCLPGNQQIPENEPDENIAAENVPFIPETLPTETPNPPTATPIPTVEPAPQVIEAEISAATLNLRSGPSMLHNIISQYQQGEIVKVLGRAPGNEWVKILAIDNKTGWMFITHLTLNQNVEILPILEITESLVVKGKVVDASGNGIPGIQVAVTRLGGAQRVRVDGTSLADGTFYAYAPAEYQGTWIASVVGIDCASPIVDANCRYAGVFYPEEGINLVLPVFEEITFTYK
jgi:hypothetical protein